MTKLLLITSSLLAVLLLFLNAYGINVNLVKKYDKVLDKTYKDRHQIPGYTTRLTDVSVLKKLASEPINEFDLRAVNELVFGSLRHTNLRRIEIHENWILWLLGHAFDPLGRTQDASKIITGGAAICSEAVSVINHVAELNGFKSRFVALSGHVVAEVFIAGKWQLVDPDYGITFAKSYAELIRLPREQLRELVVNKVTARGFSRKRADIYLDILTTKTNNSVRQSSEALSPTLHAAERSAELLKWLLPVLMLFPLISRVPEFLRNLNL